MVRPSGPAVLKLPLFLIACETISGEKRNAELFSRYYLRSFHLRIRVDGLLVWGTIVVNNLTKAVFISRLRVRSLGEKVMS